MLHMSVFDGARVEYYDVPSVLFSMGNRVVLAEVHWIMFTPRCGVA